MKKISIKALNLDYPVFNSSLLSLRKQIVSKIGGNFLKKNEDKLIM